MLRISAAALILGLVVLVPLGCGSDITTQDQAMKQKQLEKQARKDPGDGGVEK